MTVRVTAVLVALGVIALSACGSSDSSGSADKGSTTIVGGADPKSVAVIKSWADELRAGDVAAASERFALPTVVQNGTPALTLTSRNQVEAFNRSLPCGARLTAAVPTGRFTVATFVLTERPGAGECGNGVGEQAKTAFVIRDGLITQWRRVVDTGPPPSSTGPVV